MLLIPREKRIFTVCFCSGAERNKQHTTCMFQNAGGGGGSVSVAQDVWVTVNEEAPCFTGRLIRIKVLSPSLKACFLLLTRTSWCFAPDAEKYMLLFTRYEHIECDVRFLLRFCWTEQTLKWLEVIKSSSSTLYTSGEEVLSSSCSTVVLLSHDRFRPGPESSNSPFCLTCGHFSFFFYRSFNFICIIFPHPKAICTTTKSSWLLLWEGLVSPVLNVSWCSLQTKPLHLLTWGDPLTRTSRWVTHL